MAAWKRKKETREELVALLSFRGNLTVFSLKDSFLVEPLYPLIHHYKRCLTSQQEKKKDLRMRSSACQSELRAKWGRADGHCFKPLTRMTLSPPQLCPTAHRTSIFLIGCFRCWTKQTHVHARTSARCIMGTIYQSHHALQALNTATVFRASLSRSSFFPPAIFLTSLPLPLFFSGRLLCWCSCLFIMPVRKSGPGWKWREEQVCRLSDKFALPWAQCTTVL